MNIKLFTILSLASLLALASGCNRAQAPQDNYSTSAEERQIQSGENQENITAEPEKPKMCAKGYPTEIFIGNTGLCVSIVTSSYDQRLGLSNRLFMEKNHGMLFDFSGNPKKAAFWMKDMRFAIDFVWMRKGKVIAITPNVSAPAANTPDSKLPQYSPPSEVDMVLEVNAGWSGRHEVRVGDKVGF